MENKLGITQELELSLAEERLSKKRALELFDNNVLESSVPGTFSTLATIHAYLFQDIYQWAGTARSVNISKGNFRFAPVLYLEAALKAIDSMPQQTFEQCLGKYVEMNIAHPFREGNGRATRIWLNHLLQCSIGRVIDWSKVDKEDYLLAMQRSPIKDTEIKAIIFAALTENVNDRQLYLKGIDASYHFEGYTTYRAQDL